MIFAARHHPRRTKRTAEMSKLIYSPLPRNCRNRLQQHHSKARAPLKLLGGAWAEGRGSELRIVLRAAPVAVPGVVYVRRAG